MEIEIEKCATRTELFVTVPYVFYMCLGYFTYAE